MLVDVEMAAQLDARLIDITARRDAIRARVNAISKEVGQLRRDGDVGAAEQLQAESRELGDDERVLAVEHVGVATARRELLLGIPNLPHPDAPDGAGDTDNPVVKGPIGPNRDRRRTPADTSLGDGDRTRGARQRTSRQDLRCDVHHAARRGRHLARALCQYGLDLNADVHEEVRPPSLVTSATLTATGQLPKFADDAYAIERDDLWCIPTAEVPLTSIYADETLDDTQLPIRMMAHSASYRREAGSAGRDTRGMLRAHEFDKVEILALAAPEQAPALLDDMVARAERAIAGLGLTYRIIEICTGDMGQSHHRSFDIEVYAPGVDTWLEVSSISWFSDYQARRANIRFRRHDADGKLLKGTEFVHTLNGSALAVPRVWAAIIETYRNPDGSVTVPEVLRPYMRGIERIERVVQP